MDLSIQHFFYGASQAGKQGGNGGANRIWETKSPQFSFPCFHGHQNPTQVLQERFPSLFIPSLFSIWIFLGFKLQIAAAAAGLELCSSRSRFQRRWIHPCAVGFCSPKSLLPPSRYPQDIFGIFSMEFFPWNDFHSGSSKCFEARCKS